MAKIAPQETATILPGSIFSGGEVTKITHGSLGAPTAPETEMDQPITAEPEVAPPSDTSDDAQVNPETQAILARTAVEDIRQGIAAHHQTIKERTAPKTT